MRSVSEAQQLILAQVERGGSDCATLAESLGHTLRRTLVSSRAIPPFDKALMDGFAVRAEDLNAGVQEFDVLEMVAAGQVATQGIVEGTCIQIMTGAPLPAGADVVVPVEESQFSTDRSSVTLNPKKTESGSNILPLGTVMREGDELIPSGRVIRAAEIALFAEMGQSEIEVGNPPSVAILATGDELVQVGQPTGPAQICNSNEPMLAAQVRQAGGEPVPLGIARDELSELEAKIRTGLEADFLLLSGGVSAGERDLVPAVLSQCGVEQVFHKVQVKPGKPLWFGCLARQDDKTTYVFGLPGNPVSSMVCFELFVRPALRAFLGQSPLPEPVFLPLAKAHVAQAGRPTYHPARLCRTSAGLQVEAVDWKGSSDLLATTRADCLIHFPAVDRELTEGEIVEVVCPAIDSFF